MLIASLDPGESSGAAILEVPATGPAVLVEAFQTPGGVEGFLSLVDRLPKDAIWLCEKFSPRPGSVTGFSQSLKTTLPLVCEGVLIGRGLMPVYKPQEKRWRDPNGQYPFGGDGKAEKKKRQHGWLKANGFYRTGKDLDAPDADDFRSAAAHGVGYIVKELKHKPTWNLVTGESE